jgi:hypothetical protein
MMRHHNLPGNAAAFWGNRFKNSLFPWKIRPDVGAAHDTGEKRRGALRTGKPGVELVTLPEVRASKKCRKQPHAK